MHNAFNARNEQILESVIVRGLQLHVVGINSMHERERVETFEWVGVTGSTWYERQVWSLTHYFASFGELQGSVKKCVLYKHTVKVCFICFWPPGNSELTPISALIGVCSEGRKLRNGLVDRPGEHIPSGDCWIKAVLIPFNIFDKGKQRNSDFRTLPRTLRYDIASFWIHILRNVSST